MIPSAVMQEGLIIPFIFNLLSYCVRNEWRNEWTYEWISDFLGPIHILRNIFVGLFIAHLQKFNTCTDYRHQKRAFFSKLLLLGKQIGLNFFEAFGVFSAKLLALLWHCESLIHEKCSWFLLQKTLVFRSKIWMPMSWTIRN